MPFFTKQVAHDLFGDLWTKMVNETQFGPTLRAENLSVMFVCNDPDVIMFVDGNGPLFDDAAKDKVATVTMKMSSDTAHFYWLKKLNVPKALALRQIKAKGPVGKILQLMPLLKPGQALYPDYCKKYGLPTDIK
jgi:putative sterol carrier protein